jgi:hypothetical protein
VGLGTFYHVGSAFLKFATVAFIGALMQRLRIIAVIAGRWLAILRTANLAAGRGCQFGYNCAHSHERSAG